MTPVDGVLLPANYSTSWQGFGPHTIAEGSAAELDEASGQRGSVCTFIGKVL